MINDDIEKGRPGQFFEDFLKEQANLQSYGTRANGLI